MKPTTSNSYPLRILRALANRLRSANPADMVPAIIENQCSAHSAQLGQRVDETCAIDRRLHSADRDIDAALNDDKTPGIIDPNEASHIRRVIGSATVLNQTHRQNLQRMIV